MSSSFDLERGSGSMVELEATEGLSIFVISALADWTREKEH
jgi:hypothetical protein